MILSIVLQQSTKFVCFNVYVNLLKEKGTEDMVRPDSDLRDDR